MTTATIRPKGKRPTITHLTDGHKRLIQLLAVQAAEDWLTQHSNRDATPHASRDLRPL